MTPQELKSSILQLAIRGKLVGQTPQDGFSETIRKKSISKDSDEIPYDIPDTWHWCRLENLATLYNGRAYKKPEMLVEGEYPLLRVGNLFTSDTWYYSDLELEPEKYCDNGDLLYAWSASFGPYIWNGGKVIYHYHIWKLDLCYPQTRDYLYWVLAAQTDAIKRGGHGSTMIHITKAGTEKMLIPVPPLAEQKRIVAKIEELLPLIDRYEKAWNRLEDFSKRFPMDMQKSILQMAIQGKLVEQRPEEGTGEELFQQIQAEKQKLFKEGKIKKEKPLHEISEEEILFEIPESWKWAYLIDIIEDKPSNGYSPKGVDYVTEIRNLTLTATTSGRFKADAFKYVDIPQSEAAKYWLKKGDLLVQRSNSRELVGTSCIYTGTDNAFIYPDLMMRMRVMNGIYVKYIDYVLKSPMVRSYYMVSASGTSESMPKINQKTVSLTLIPLPPLAEQKRIVAKLEEILPLCERLK